MFCTRLIPKFLFPGCPRVHIVSKVVGPSQYSKAQRLRKRTIELKMILGPPWKKGTPFVPEEPVESPPAEPGAVVGLPPAEPPAEPGAVVGLPPAEPPEEPADVVGLAAFGSAVVVGGAVEPGSKTFLCEIENCLNS